MNIDDQQKQVIIDEWKHEQMQKYFISNETICPWCLSTLVKKREGLVCKTGGMECPFYFKLQKGWVFRDDKPITFIRQQRNGLTQRTRFKVYIRDGYKCKSCGAIPELTSDPFEVDHIIPLSKGGTNEMDNLQVLCATCNRKKGNMIEALNPEMPLESSFNQQNKAQVMDSGNTASADGAL